MYSLDIFTKCNVIPTWNLVYYGVENGYLDFNDVREFAIQCIGKDDNREEVLALAWINTDKIYVMEQMQILIQGTTEPNVEKIWQYCIVKTTLETYTEYEKVSDRLDMIYADFFYPKEMEEFIKYMPPKGYDPSLYSKEENQNRLINKAWQFVREKEKELQIKTKD